MNTLKKLKPINCVEILTSERYKYLLNKMSCPEIRHFMVQDWDSWWGVGRENKVGMSELIAEYLNSNDYEVQHDFSLTNYDESDLTSEDYILFISDDESYGLLGIYAENTELIEALEDLLSNNSRYKEPVRKPETNISPMKFAKYDI